MGLTGNFPENSSAPMSTIAEPFSSPSIIRVSPSKSSSDNPGGSGTPLVPASMQGESLVR